MSRVRKSLLQSISEFEVKTPGTARLRPAKGGCSIGYFQASAITLGCVVHDNDDPDKKYILGVNLPFDAKVGDPILQPGPLDGGRFPEDTIATLERWVHPKKRPSSRLIGNKQSNYYNLDAFIARVDNPDLVSPEIAGIGYLKGVVDAKLGMEVMKIGRTTGLTIDEVSNINASHKLFYDKDRIYEFDGLIECGNMSKGGDSGALLIDKRRYAIGLLMGGSEKITLYFPIQRVLDYFNVSLIIKKDNDSDPI